MLTKAYELSVLFNIFNQMNTLPSKAPLSLKIAFTRRRNNSRLGPPRSSASSFVFSSLANVTYRTSVLSVNLRRLNCRRADIHTFPRLMKIGLCPVVTTLSLWALTIPSISSMLNVLVNLKTKTYFMYCQQTLNAQ